MPGILSLLMASAVVTVTDCLSTTYSGELGCLSRCRTAAEGIRSGPASAVAALAADIDRVISGGSAVTVSVCTVIASTVPSLLTISPRTTGSSVVVIRSCWPSARYLADSTPCS